MDDLGSSSWWGSAHSSRWRARHGVRRYRLVAARRVRRSAGRHERDGTCSGNIATGFSFRSHYYFVNTDRVLFRRLVLPGVVGAYVLTSLPGEVMRPYVSTYVLLMGRVIIVKAFRTFAPLTVTLSI